MDKITPSEILPGPEGMLTVGETANFTRLSVQTLATWRNDRRPTRKRVPLPYVKIGGRILYKASDVRAFIESNTKTPGETKKKGKRAA
jgi:hypothetical protein